MNSESLRLYETRQEEIKNENLWKEMKINFQLEAFGFPDNKIYGTINIIPESSRQLIKTLVLIVNKTNRIEFNPYFIHLSATGFNVNRKNPCAYIEAIPYNEKWMNEKKVSKICYFFFSGEHFILTPTIKFELIKDKINLRIQWFHIGDKYAQKYVLIFDEAEVHYIRQKIIMDVFDVQIEDFQSGEKHKLQIAARLNNGKETYRSDLIEFVIPNREKINDDIEFVTVSNDPIPPNLPVFPPTDDDIIQEDFHRNDEESSDKNKRKNSQSSKQQNGKSRSKIHTCCKHIPHKTFPGIEHYFQNISKKSSSSSFNENTSDDDDDDVIMTKN